MNKATRTILIGVVVVCIIIIICTRPRWYLWMKSYIHKPKFYGLDDFPELQPFHDAFEDIRAEYLTITNKINYDNPRPQRVWSGEHKEEAHEYLTKNKDIHGWMSAWKTGTDEGDTRWVNFPLYALGVQFEKNLSECPTLARLLKENSSFIRIAGFSKLLPRADIEQHVDSTGMPWGTMSYHLGLVIPEKTKCVLKVDGEKKYHAEGESFLFESTYQHSAENNTDSERTILYIEISI
jgi:aspartyl/asparaginyl beta-hydroxylase (cupin superfamily)